MISEGDELVIFDLLRLIILQQGEKVESSRIPIPSSNLYFTLNCNFFLHDSRHFHGVLLKR